MTKMNSSNKAENNKKNLILFLFVFTMMFSFEIAGYDMRYVVLIFWALFSFISTKKIYVSFKLIMFPAILLFLISYSFILVSLYKTNNSFEILRCTRAFITYVVILLFLSSGRYTAKQIVNTLSFVLTLHALCIIFGIFFPVIKDIVLPISQYSKEFMSIRSTGFSSGYDDAGYLCNIGLILTFVNSSANKKKLVTIYSLIFIIAVIFTSRVNIVCMTFIFGITFLYNLKKMNLKEIISIGKYLLVIGVFIITVLSLTTNFGFEWRIQLLYKYPILNKLYSLMGLSYSDYGIYTYVIANHFSMSDLELSDIVFGAGIRKTTSDIGYIKTIYSIGIIGVVIQISTYIKSILNMKLLKNFDEKNLFLHILASTFIASVMLMIMMEFKGSFIIASTTFELLSIIYITCELPSMKIT